MNHRDEADRESRWVARVAELEAQNEALRIELEQVRSERNWLRSWYSQWGYSQAPTPLTVPAPKHPVPMTPSPIRNQGWRG